MSHKVQINEEEYEQKVKAYVNRTQKELQDFKNKYMNNKNRNKMMIKEFCNDIRFFDQNMLLLFGKQKQPRRKMLKDESPMHKQLTVKA